mmetsp:Transcript_60967/g.159692  ORF Transcript_60967/g.159692 Transcript_60967/m.159692 type:complete len:82 (-) Transcript_60967:62-307(-)
MVPATQGEERLTATRVGVSRAAATRRAAELVMASAVWLRSVVQCVPLAKTKAAAVARLAFLVPASLVEGQLTAVQFVSVAL